MAQRKLMEVERELDDFRRKGGMSQDDAERLQRLERENRDPGKGFPFRKILAQRFTRGSNAE